MAYEKYVAPGTQIYKTHKGVIKADPISERLPVADLVSSQGYEGL